jgi:hypothetical protein
LIQVDEDRARNRFERGLEPDTRSAAKHVDIRLGGERNLQVARRPPEDLQPQDLRRQIQPHVALPFDDVARDDAGRAAAAGFRNQPSMSATSAALADPGS